MFSKEVIGNSEAERSQILDEKYSRRAGVPFSKWMNLPKACNEDIDADDLPDILAVKERSYKFPGNLLVDRLMVCKKNHEGKPGGCVGIQRADLVHQFFSIGLKISFR